MAGDVCEVGRVSGCNEIRRARAMIPMLHEGTGVGWLVVKSHTLAQVPPFSRATLETVATQMANAIARMTTSRMPMDFTMEDHCLVIKFYLGAIALIGHHDFTSASCKNRRIDLTAPLSAYWNRAPH